MNRTTKFALFVAAPALMLAGCNAAEEGTADADGDGKISSEEMAGAAKALTKLQPGEYKMSMELLEIEDANLSEEDIKKAKEGFAMMSNMAPPRCITGEEEDEGMMGLAKEMQNGDCETTKLNSSASKIDAEMTCSGPNGTATVVLDGTASETSSSMTMTMSQPEGQDAGGPKKAVMRIGMERTGDCQAEAAG